MKRLRKERVRACHRIGIVSALGAMLLAASPGFAQQPRRATANTAGGTPSKLAYHAQLPELHPNLARGTAIGRKFDLGVEALDGSAINLFNGNLAFEVPIGIRYPINDRLGYSLALRYNSAVWDHRPTTAGPTAEPRAETNAGLGFELSFGTLQSPGDNATGQWLYQSPDGGPHLFYSTLHWDTPDDIDPTDRFLYTRDSSYLRLEVISTTEAVLGFPNGTVHTFAPQNGTWRVTRISTIGGTGALDIDYTNDALWQLQDTTGRTHQVVLIDDPARPGTKLVDRVELAAFDGAIATYQFAYQQVSVARDCADHRGGTTTASVLTGVTDPTGYTRSFGYHDIGATCVESGRIASAQLNAGGFVEWSYGNYPFPAFACDGSTPGYFTTVAGVTEKRLVQPNGTVHGTWTYLPQLLPTNDPKGDPTPSCQQSERRTRVITPVGDTTWHYFSVATQPGIAGGPAEYGMPFARGHGAVGAGLLLSSRTYDCDAGGVGCALMISSYMAFEQDTACGTITGQCFDTNRRLTGHRKAYHQDPDASGSPRYAGFARSDFDGLGHFRTRSENGNFGQSDIRIQTTHHNPDRGSYAPGAGTFTMVPTNDPWVLTTFDGQTSSDGTTTVRRDLCFDNAGRLVRERRLAGTGPSVNDTIVERVWQNDNVVQEAFHGGDLQTVSISADLCALSLGTPEYSRDRNYAFGSLARETYLDAGGALLPFHTTDRDIDPSTGLTAAARDVSGIETAFLYDRLGRQTWRRPAAGHGAWNQKLHGASTGGSSWWDGRRTTTRIWDPAVTTILEVSTQWFDVFGNRTATEDGLPDGQFSRQRFQHNALGWKTSESTPFERTQGPSGWTTFEDHDPLGRARTVVPPEGSQHATTYSYKGIREATRSAQAAFNYFGGSSCGEGTITTRSIFDRQGRLSETIEDRPVPVPGSLRTTTHTYDVAGSLVRMEITDEVDGVSRVQRRDSTWDGRAFELSRIERRNGAIIDTRTFDLHDSRGHLRRETHWGEYQPYPGITLTSTYDAAERLTMIADGDDPTRLWKETAFGATNAFTCSLPPQCGGEETNDPACSCDGAPDASIANATLGKPVMARRHNYRDSVHVTVTEHFAYRGVGGGVSDQTLSIEKQAGALAGLPKTYSAYVDYSDAGDVVAHGYPICVGCAEEPVVSHELRLGSERGFLTSIESTLEGAIQSWVDDVAWSPSRVPASVVHGNGHVDRFDRDPLGRERLDRVRVDFDPTACATCTDYDSGAFVYDGEQALCGVGDDARIHPPTAPVDPGPPTGCAAAAVHDPFGRRTGAFTDSDCQSGQRYYLYDSRDRLIGLLDHSAKEQIEVPGLGWIWDWDTTRWTNTWNLYGIGVKTTWPLRVVVDDWTGDWRSTFDRVQALGRTLGEAGRHIDLPNPVRRHLHPMDVRATTPAGQPAPYFPQF